MRVSITGDGVIITELNDKLDTYTAQLLHDEQKEARYTGNTECLGRFDRPLKKVARAVAKLAEDQNLTSRVLTAILTDKKIKPGDAEDTLYQMFKIVIEDDNILDLKSPISVIGDLHGSLVDLLHCFSTGGLPPKTSYLFLGDVVDRGQYSMECLLLLAILKSKYPANIHLLRGNHEDMRVSAASKRSEISSYFDNTFDVSKMESLFTALPLAAIIDDSLYCCHGGLNEQMMSIEKLQSVNRFTRKIHESVLGCLWNDPVERDVWFQASPRGEGCYLWGTKATDAFLTSNNLKMVIRAHEMKDGVNFSHNHRIMTLFSSSQYCGYNNRGAIARINNNLIDIGFYFQGEESTRTVKFEYFKLKDEQNEEEFLENPRCGPLSDTFENLQDLVDLDTTILKDEDDEDDAKVERVVDDVASKNSTTIEMSDQMVSEADPSVDSSNLGTSVELLSKDSADNTQSTDVESRLESEKSENVTNDEFLFRVNVREYLKLNSVNRTPKINILESVSGKKWTLSAQKNKPILMALFGRLTTVIGVSTKRTDIQPYMCRIRTRNEPVEATKLEFEKGNYYLVIP